MPRYAGRFQQNWPNGFAILVFFVASEVFDDENGDKSASAWIASGVVALTVLLLVRWLRDDRSANSDDDASPER